MPVPVPVPVPVLVPVPVPVPVLVPMCYELRLVSCLYYLLVLPTDVLHYATEYCTVDTGRVVYGRYVCGALDDASTTIRRQRIDDETAAKRQRNGADLKSRG